MVWLTGTKYPTVFTGVCVPHLFYCCVWFFSRLCRVCPMFPMSLDYLFLIVTLVPLIFISYKKVV
jgi:hypothetical protein